MKTLGRTCLLEANLILVAGVTNTYRLRWLRRVTDKNGVTVVRPMDLTGWTPHMQVRRDGLTVIDLAPLHAPGHGRDHHHPRPGRGHARPARGRGRVGPAPRRPLGRRDPPGRRARACRNHRERHRKESALIRALDGCSCDEGPVIILEDAIIGDVSIVYATDADIDNLFPTPTTDKEEHDG